MKIREFVINVLTASTALLALWNVAQHARIGSAVGTTGDVEVVLTVPMVTDVAQNVLRTVIL